MKKRSTLLKVMSIIYIVLGALSLLSGIMMIAMRSTIEQVYSTMGMEAPTTFSYILTFVGAIIYLASGIIGILYKSKQSVLIIGVVFALYEVFNIVFAAVTTFFTPLSLVGLIWPILYLWGWYQSN